MQWVTHTHTIKVGRVLVEKKKKGFNGRWSGDERGNGREKLLKN